MIKQDMNMNYKPSVFLLFLVIFALTTSACGMRRALTLPPREQAQEGLEKKADAEKNKEMREETEEEIRSE